MPPTQVETVLTTPNDALIGKPTMENAVPIVEKTLIAPKDLCLWMHVVVCCKHFCTSVAFHYTFL